MSDDHVMSHTRVLSPKEGNTRAEKRGLDSSVSKRERERERGGKRGRVEDGKREKGISSPRGFQPDAIGEGGVEKRGETTRKRAKEGTNEA